ncbi:TPA: usher protein, partial [Escherichia coli]|nr:usher protein [Escherichia coli]
SGGQVLKDDIQDEPNLFQASYYYGLNNYLTGYTGIQITDNNYTAGLLGKVRISRSFLPKLTR